MKQKTDQEDLIVRYFFEELSEEEQEQVETQFLANNSFFEQMLSVEDALIDAYAQGQLSDVERKKVEDFLLPSSRRDRELEFVNNLIGDLARTQPANPKDAASVWEKRPSRWRFLLTLLGIKDSGKRYSFALLFLLASGLALVIWNLMLQNSIRHIRTDQAALEKRNEDLQQHIAAQADRNEELEKEIQKERSERDQLEQKLASLYESTPRKPPNDVLTLSLTSDLFARGRGSGELKVIRIGSSVNMLQIRIAVDRESDYKNYSAIIKTFGGREVWSRDALNPRPVTADRIVFTIPASLLTNEDYTLTLMGRTANDKLLEIGEYSFRVQR